MSLQVADQIETERQQLHQHWQQRLERAHYEVQRAARQYHAVEPENRLVARTLEQRWEQALETAEKLNIDFQEIFSVGPASNQLGRLTTAWKPVPLSYRSVS